MNPLLKIALLGIPQLVRLIKRKRAQKAADFLEGTLTEANLEATRKLLREKARREGN